jgi:hypothetical protein
MSGVSLLFGGDAHAVPSTANADPLAAVRGLLSRADIGFLNFEAAIPDDAAPVETLRKKNVLRATAESARYLREAGFHVVNVANNHLFDFGLPGCRMTIRELERQGLAVLGLRDGGGSRPVVLERRGMRVGFLGYADYGFPGLLMGLRKPVVLSDIRKLRRSVDFLVVSLHWGFEYVPCPSPRQRRMARAFVDAGANMVVGQHPHVSQGMESYRGALISYSLGNLLFTIDEMPLRASPARRDSQYGFLLSVRADRTGIHDAEALPVSAFQSDGARILEGPARERSLARLRRLSRELDRRAPGYLRWLWDASSTFALLLRTAWAWQVKQFGARKLLGAAWDIAFNPLLLPMLFISYLRFPRAPAGGIS